jgi:hypothetical protein
MVQTWLLEKNDSNRKLTFTKKGRLAKGDPPKLKKTKNRRQKKNFLRQYPYYISNSKPL